MLTENVDRYVPDSNQLTFHLAPGQYTPQEIEAFSDALSAHVRQLCEETPPQFLSEGYGRIYFQVPARLRNQEEMDYVMDHVREFITEEKNATGEDRWQLTVFRLGTGRVIARVHEVGSRWGNGPGVDIKLGTRLSRSAEDGSIYTGSN